MVDWLYTLGIFAILLCFGGLIGIGFFYLLAEFGVRLDDDLF